MMTHKERVDAVFTQQPTDRTCFGFVDGGAWMAKMEGLTYRELYNLEDGGASIIVKYTDMVDTDFVSGVNGVFTAPLNSFGAPIQIDESGSPTNTGTCIKDPVAEIPLLDKSKIRETLMSGEFFSNMVKQCRCINELVGDRKYLIGDIAGPYTLASVMVGLAPFLKLMKKNPELVEQLMDFTTALCAEIYHILAENGCSIAFIAEPVAAGNMLSPKAFDQWVRPALLNVKAELKEYRYIISHICGGSGNRVIPLTEMGIDCFSGDYLVDLDQALTDADNKMTIMGNLNPAGNLILGDADAVYNEACELIKTAAGRPYIIAPGCDISSASPYDNIAAIGRAVKDMAAN